MSIHKEGPHVSITHDEIDLKVQAILPCQYVGLASGRYAPYWNAFLFLAFFQLRSVSGIALQYLLADLINSFYILTKYQILPS